MSKPTYIKCPRCELNYIKSNEEYCPVCLAEMRNAGDMNFSDEQEAELCPVCGQNFISADQTMCEECMAAHLEAEENANEKEERDIVPEKEDDWQDDTMIQEDEDVELVSFSDIEEKEDDFDDDDESEEEESDKMGDELESDFDYNIDDDEYDEEDEDDDYFDEEDEDDE